MAREPIFSARDLAQLKGVCQQTIYNRAKKVPLPPPVELSGGDRISVNRNHAARYLKSELLAWWEATEKALRK